MLVSIIIPALNEAQNLGCAVPRRADGIEVIVADGGSTDGTAQAALSMGASVVHAPRGRGAQMDAGALASKGEILVFLHADSVLPQGWMDAMTAALRDERVVGGAFRLTIGSRGKLLRIVEGAVTLRSRLLGLYYGDQAIFARRDAFMRAGGFKNLPLMEDVDCVKRLRKLGRLVLLDKRVVTSSRRWDRKGVLPTTLRNLLFLTLYFAGVSPARLYRWYY